MASTGRRLQVSVFIALLCAAQGCKTSGTVRGRTIHKVVVGPSETQVDPEEVTIYSDTSEGGDRIHWELIDSERKPDKKRKLYIEFERPDVFSDVKMNPN